MRTCDHDAPKTQYATQGTRQLSAPVAGALPITSGNVMPVFYGALCDQCARDFGLSPTAFFRDLEPTS